MVNPLNQPSKPSLLSVIPFIALLFLGFAGFVEIAMAWPLPGVFYLSVGLVFAVLFIPLFRRRRRFEVLACCGLFYAGLVVLYGVPWNSRKPFLRDFRQIEPGMSTAQVETIMQPYFRGTGWPASPFVSDPQQSMPLHIPGSGSALVASNTSNGKLAFEGRLVFRHSDAGAFNADMGIVEIAHGRVVSTEFSPD